MPPPPKPSPLLPDATAPPRKLPLLEPGSAFFWTGGADGQLRIQRCGNCGHWQHPPQPRCSKCQSEAVSPQTVSGRGRLASYTVNQEAWVPGLTVPFVFAVIELEEQAELYVFSNMLGSADGGKAGMAVTVTFEQHEDVWLPMFEVAT